MTLVSQHTHPLLSPRHVLLREQCWPKLCGDVLERWFPPLNRVHSPNLVNCSCWAIVWTGTAITFSSAVVFVFLSCTGQTLSLKEASRLAFRQALSPGSVEERCRQFKLTPSLHEYVLFRELDPSVPPTITSQAASPSEVPPPYKQSIPPQDNRVSDSLEGSIIWIGGTAAFVLFTPVFYHWLIHTLQMVFIRSTYHICSNY